MPAPFARLFPANILNQADLESTFQLKAINLTSRGAFKGNVLMSGPGPLYQLWQMSVTFPNMESDEWRSLGAFLADCYDNRTPMRLFDPLRQTPRGTFGNNDSGSGTLWGDNAPWADGTLWDDRFFDGLVVAENAPAGRDSILLSGAPVNTANVALPGDLIEIDGFLYECVASATSDSLGRLRLRIRPRLREPVFIGASVKAQRASSAFYLQDPDQLFISRRTSTRWGSISLSFIEALP